MSKMPILQSGGRNTLWFGPHDPRAVVAEWTRLRGRMIRRCPPEFNRDEWAYLIASLDPGKLLEPWQAHWGSFTEEAPDRAALIRPREPVALWTPNNVSLLGPLVVIQLSLLGSTLVIKGASAAADLCGALLAFVQEYADDLPLLSAWITEKVTHACFDRTDPRNASMAASAKLRLVFGGDEAARAIEHYPHPVDSLQFSFADRRSVAWLSPDHIDDAVLDTLIKVFAIYGQAGCTSPSHLWLMDGSRSEADALRDRLCERWPQILRLAPEPHLASANTLAFQRARVQGWSPALAGQREAVIATGGDPAELPEGLRMLPILHGNLEAALGALPASLQTIGTATDARRYDTWLTALAATPVKRIVPLAAMHHFQTTWDGFSWWRTCFEEVEL